MDNITLTFAEACKMLQISEPTFRKICRSENHPPFVRVGTKYLFPADLLKEWVEREAGEGRWL